MISRSVFAASKKLHQSIFRKPTLHLLPSSFSFFSSTPHQDSHNLYKLNHKDWLSPNEVLKIFSNLKEPTSIISVLNQYSQRKDYKPNEALFTLVINHLAQAKSFDAIEHIMQRIKVERSCRLSDEFFYNVVKIYGNQAGRIKKAIDTLFDMPNGYKCWPSVKTFNFVLNLLVANKLFDEIHEIYLSANRLGIEIDECCLNILVKGKQGKVEEGMKLLERMKVKGCYPNAGSYQEVLYGLLDKERFMEAKEILGRMICAHMNPSFVSYKKLIDGLCREKLVEDVDLVLKQMVQQGFVPRMGMWRAIVRCVLSGNNANICLDEIVDS
ncbi:hypothetical protein Patl1_05003 [Pistacia atlantica]|uniref:Uncharacterized protein n=1 Tax=Pistacia atlantica TaxID=434234 RepID=A0ACC1BSX8_9ROSI|nr:hypothetical protein Patl1_05003 [Pistacia atlantica]